MMTGGTFEALNYALRKSKDGVIVSFVVHPSDVDSALTALPIGARVEIKWAEIGDDETPKGGDAHTVESKSHTDNTNPPHAEQSATHGARKLSEQCALRCKDSRFWKWLSIASAVTIDSEEKAVARVRAILHVKSRSYIDSDPNTGAAWQRMEHRFHQHLFDQMHAGSYR